MLPSLFSIKISNTISIAILGKKKFCYLAESVVYHYTERHNKWHGQNVGTVFFVNVDMGYYTCCVLLWTTWPQGWPNYTQNCLVVCSFRWKSVIIYWPDWITSNSPIKTHQCWSGVIQKGLHNNRYYYELPHYL